MDIWRGALEVGVAIERSVLRWDLNWGRVIQEVELGSYPGSDVRGLCWQCKDSAFTLAWWKLLEILNRGAPRPEVGL